MVALTVTVPADVVFSILPLIVAPVVPAFTTLHIIVLFVAFGGFTLPDKNNGVTACVDVGTSVICVTGICDEVTVILKSCV